ncbi:DNA cytosine methyltransferase [Trueperella abortisuis]|uniref:Site-specific DNA-cytosine methylase n=1 Tax=Trueperella abortisuis TaxID=445930 RepID=A0ABT9PJX1_9ACTO|nr:DNA cytosine methyltransferase [Trueperella abortisuis]MDP9833020.1 site-specific DNA-cytosine methylase [Trueperella abortisuis]
MITTTDRYALTTSWTTPRIEDTYFRMLTPDEVKLGMAFPAHYQAVGNGREQVRMWGNAVTPPAARDLYTIAANTLAA